ncbi:MAG: hypothetical protein OXU81_18145 [Gammaproteobacteria bacterium]|nr:hypothetical protein [Gammaproteobacteria bacterium]
MEAISPPNASKDTTRMRGKRINIFMWGYQPHFRIQLEHQANRLMEELGVPEAGV